MNLDVQTLLVLMLANVFAMSLALPALMGWRVSTAARFAIASTVVQALAWVSFLLARPIHDRFFSTLWIAGLCASFALLWHALRHWLGPRPAQAWVLPLALLTPIGYGLGFGHYPFRVGWSNLGLALMMGLICLALAAPAPQASRRWRGLILLCLAALAGVTLLRGVLGAFFTELYPQLRTPHPVNVVAMLLNHIALTMTTIGVLVAWREEAERELREQAQTDGLTGLMNRRAFIDRAADQMAQARRHGHPLAVLLIDLDHFKQINDTAGHAAGDRALQVFASALRACLRQGDLACRYGGEEFGVLLSHADEAAARAFDRRLRAALLARLARPGAGVEPFGYSAGLALLRPQDASLGELLNRADAALYRAKAQGRGRLASQREDAAA